MSVRSDQLSCVAVKLRSLLELAPMMCGGTDDFPWPQLIRLAESLAVGKLIEGYWR